MLRLAVSRAVRGDLRRSVVSVRHSARKMSTQTENHIQIGPVPENRYQDVLDHVTPIFLRDEPLSKCFPPCVTGARERQFRSYATTQLKSGLCIMAVDTSNQKVIGSCLSRPLIRAEVMSPYKGSYDEDVLLQNVVKMLMSVHQELDLFSKYGVEEVLELGLVSIEPTHVGRGLGTKLFRAGIELGASRGFTVLKADCTGTASAKACQRAGLTAVHTLNYQDYTPGGVRVFSNPGVGNPALTVCVGRAQNKEPYLLPIEPTKL